MNPTTSQLAPEIRRLHAAAKRLDAPVAFMEVCGTHTVAAFRSGLHSLMPDNVRLVSGPGCPVCVTSQGDIDLLISLALRPNTTLCTYGDMIRVTGASGSLEKARARGADVRVIYSTLDAVRLAATMPEREVILAAVGFETTAPATAVAVLDAYAANLTNFSVFASHKLVIPAMRALLDGGDIAINGFLCPGHVSVILGSGIFEPIVTDYGLSCVVGGFEGPHIAAALARLVELAADGTPAMENLYPQAVGREGNEVARKLMDEVFEAGSAKWRGLGAIPDSGQWLRERFRAYDARAKYALVEPEDHEPPGCICGKIITGKAMPNECRLFGTACTPVSPIGPCMVSSEGTCAAWFKYGKANQRPVGEAVTA